MTLFSVRGTLFRYIVISITVLLCVFLLAVPAIQYTTQHYNEQSLEQKAQVQFQIPSPGREQIADLTQQPFIDAVFPYYDIFSTIELSSGRRFSNYYAMLVEDTVKLPFTQDSLQIVKENAVNTPAAYVDYAFVKKYGVKQNDVFTIALGSITLSVPITAIIENCSSLTHIQQDGGTGVIIVSVPSTLIDELGKIKEAPIYYSGAYLRVNNHAQAREFLRTYKPLARLRDPGMFKSIEDYHSYLNDFNNTSYESETRDLSPEQSLVQSTNILINAFLILAVMLLCVVLCAFVSFNMPTVKNKLEDRIRNGEEINSVAASIRSTVSLTLIWALFLYGILLVLFISRRTIYCPLLVYLPFVLISWGGALIFGSCFAASYTRLYLKKFVLPRR